MKGKIESTTSKGDFKIEFPELTMDVQYDKWFSSEANTTMDGENWTIKPNSIWHNDFGIYASDVEIEKISFNWKGNAILKFADEEFILKFKGLLNRRFELENRDGELIMVVVPGLKWTKLRYDYEIELNETKISSDLVQKILFASAYASNISTSYYWNV